MSERDRWGKVVERRNANQRAYSARNRERLCQERRERYAKDTAFRARKKALDKAYRARNPERVRDNALRAKYGISLAEYEAMKAAQGGRCAVCARVPAGKGKSATLHIDHCHATGAVRGLLCDACNRAIGLMGDSAATLAKASMYLVTKQAASVTA